jgi:hypothetical protein
MGISAAIYRDTFGKGEDIFRFLYFDGCLVMADIHLI